MLGVIMNAAAIVVGSLLGLLLHKGIKESFRQTMLDVTALAVVVIGIIGAIKTQNVLLLVISLVIGSFLGEAMRIEHRLNQLGHWIECRLTQGGSGLTRGFVTASLVFCVGSMAIVGSIESGMTGNHGTLLAKSILDGIFSIFFASTMGIGVAFSALPVLLYEGLLTLSAAGLKPLLTEPMIVELTAVGGVLILAIGINQLQLKKMSIGNMLPSVFVPVLYFALTQLF
ncbi:MAG: DUF554 domain-containing protein [Eubacteriales bacterium]|nr:DUF554 domain-containing protein [Clostridiales bacterium]MDD2442059.1 DUF554 domain-containing protein [Eubacteriales bacterium]MDD4140148.1 DUF554 domain-containing protein [Eubacteriales bacterium]